MRLNVKDDNLCKTCGEKYTHIYFKWCKPCQINYLKTKNETSGNEKIDNLIQEKQLEINGPEDTVFEWIPYGQLDGIKEIGKDSFATVYSATWKDGPLKYDSPLRHNSLRYYGSFRKNYVVALKCLHNAQNITNEFLNEV